MFTLDRVSAVLGVSRKTVADWWREGMPRRDDKKYDLRVVVPWVRARDTAKAAGPKGDSLDEALLKARAEEKAAKARLAEIELARVKGEILDRSDVDAGRVARVVAVRQALVGLGQEVRGLYGRTPEEIGEYVDDRVDEICKRFAGEKPERGDE